MVTVELGVARISLIEVGLVMIRLMRLMMRMEKKVEIRLSPKICPSPKKRN